MVRIGLFFRIVFYIKIFINSVFGVDIKRILIILIYVVLLVGNIVVNINLIDGEYIVDNMGIKCL